MEIEIKDADTYDTITITPGCSYSFPPAKWWQSNKWYVRNGVMFRATSWIQRIAAALVLICMFAIPITIIIKL